MIGVLFAMIATGLILPTLKSPNDYGLAFMLGLLVVAVIFNLLGRALAMFLFRSRLRFFRAYKHQ